MLPKHHLPQLIPNRIDGALRRLNGLIWENQRPVKVEASKAQPKLLSLQEGKQLKRQRVSHCSFWGKLFDQRWCKVTLPEPADKNTWLEWQDQGEATLYVDDKPYFGFNVAHRQCRLPEGTTEVWVQSSCIQSAIWHPEANGMDEKGSYFKGAFVQQRNDDAWGAYHDLKCLFDLALDQRMRENPKVGTQLGAFGQQPFVDKYSPVFRRLLSAMEQAVETFELSGFAAMRKYLAGAYKDFQMDKTFSRCILTGHAHLDLVWIWPERMGELKAVNIFSSVDRLMEDYPEFRFAYSQPASYEAVARREPDLYKRVQGRIQSKQWEATGGMYVESDTTMACGEALARSFILGQEGFKEINGEPSKLTWLPDVFGYAACLPQIMKQTGVDYFFTTKMTWNAINLFPYSSFIWRGHDGSEVLAHVTQESGYVTHMTIDNIKAPMHANQQADVHDEYLLPTGYGDGGGGPTADMLERARRLSALPGMPEIEWDQPEAFFDRLSSARDSLPTHQGECYLEYHRGTYTTHSNLKASFRNLERAMQIAEAVSSATGSTWAMQESWKRLVFSQFHDYIPGSSVWDVYLEGLPELDAHAKSQVKQANEALSGKGTKCVFNPHAVTVQQWVDDSYVCLPPLSGSSLEAVTVEAPEAVTVKGRTVSNGLTTYHLNASGFIDSLVWEGVEVPLSEPIGQLMVSDDKAANFEPWDIDRHVLSQGKICKTKPTIKAVNEGPRSGFAVTRKVGKQSEATVTFLLESGSPLIHISVNLDWQEPECLLKLLVPTTYAATNARFGAPFGTVQRSQIQNGLVAEAQWEVPFSRHMAVYDDGEREGLFVVSENKYGATVRNGQIGITLVRSPRVNGYEAHGFAWPPHLTRLKIESPYSDIGQHSIQLALGRYDADLPRESQPASLADTLFTKPLPYQGAAIETGIESLEGGDSLVPCWVKPIEGSGYIVRLHEVAGRRGQVKVKLRPGWELSTTDLSEQSHESSDGTVKFKPYELVSLCLQKQS
ncbi:MAG: alpha-mannosidase [Puniceicoccales bacterium]